MAHKEDAPEMSLMESAADRASVGAVNGTRFVLRVLPDLEIYDNYVAPVIYYFEKKDQASPWVVRVALRGMATAVLVPLVSLFGFLSIMNVACLCVTVLALGAMEAGLVAVTMVTLVPVACVGLGSLGFVGGVFLLVWLGVKTAVAGAKLVRRMLTV